MEAKDFFTLRDIEQIEELAAFNEHESTINDVQIDCYPIIYSLAVGAKGISDIKQSDIEDMFVKVELDRNFFLSIGIDDIYIFDRILQFFKIITENSKS